MEQFAWRIDGRVAKLIHYSVENKLYGLPETTVRRHNRQALRTGAR